MNLTRITRQAREVKVAGELPEVDLAALDSVDVALTAPRAAPDALTPWTPVEHADGIATVLLAGPDASADGALVVPAEADLWVRALAGDEVLVGLVERITVEGGGVPLALPTGSYVTAADLAVALAAMPRTVIHGDDAAYPRPAVTGPVIWFGSADPVNADDAQDVTVYVAPEA
jgi:hypothetical protein